MQSIASDFWDDDDAYLPTKFTNTEVEDNLQDSETSTETYNSSTEMIAQRAFTPHLAASVGLPVDRLPKNMTEAALACEAYDKAMDKIPTHEHEKTLFDIHGIDTVGGTEGDDPAFEEAKLKELAEAISHIDNNEKTAYQKAMDMNERYVQDKAFQLMFLRAEQYDVKKAAALIVYHFAKKLELFGDGDVLGRHVRLSDLSADDLESVKSGSMQISPARDVAGRTIVLGAVRNKKFKDVDNSNRATFYILMSALIRDEALQKKGAVFVIQNFGAKMESLATVTRFFQTRHAIPCRTASAHFCYNNPWLRPTLAGFRIFTLAQNMARFQGHYGSPDEVAFRLNTYGIPTDQIPTEDPNEGLGSIAWHLEWLQLQQMQEEQDSGENNENTTTSAAIVVPGRFDVLFGKGKKAREHPGTLRCQYFVEMMREKYEQASRQEKTTVADTIITAIKESKGRFLKCEKGLWVEVEHSIARGKISHFFRHMRSKAKTIETAGNAVKRSSFTDMDSPNKRRGLREPDLDGKIVFPCLS